MLPLSEVSISMAVDIFLSIQSCSVLLMRPTKQEPGNSKGFQCSMRRMIRYLGFGNLREHPGGYKETGIPLGAETVCIYAIRYTALSSGV